MKNEKTAPVSQEPQLTTKQNWWQFLKFVLFSMSAGIIQLLSFALFNDLIHLDELVRNWVLWLFNDGFGWNVVIDTWEYGPSYFLALVLSVLWNFTINRKFTFKSATNVPIAMLKVLGYYIVFTPLSTWWGEALASIGWNSYAILLPTMVINMVTEFLFCKYVVYRHSMNTAR
jgi:putative flippase GtrA